MYKFFEVFKTLRLPEELGSYLADTEVTRVSKTSTNNDIFIKILPITDLFTKQT